MSEQLTAGPTLAEMRSLIGRRFPGGTYTIEPWRAWLTADAALARPRGDLAHPLFVWMAAIGGWGMTFDDLFAWCGITAEDGPMFGEHETTIFRPLRVGDTYRVSGGVTSVDRKVGRSGVFDVVGYQMELRDVADDGLVATCWNSLIVPRKS
jgi:hypothetical protein